jgi:hypothetical protein
MVLPFDTFPKLTIFYETYIYNLLSIFGVMSKSALSWCLE